MLHENAPKMTNFEHIIDLWNRVNEIDQQKIEQLRALVYEYAHCHPDEIDMHDLRSRIISPEELQSDPNKGSSHAIRDWMLKRLLTSAKIRLDVHSAVDKFVEVFKFRAQHRVRELTRHNTLPAEFYHLAPFVDEGLDRDGNRLMIIRIKLYRQIPQMDLLIKRAIVYLIEQYDLEYEQTGVPFNIVIDTQDFNFVRNANLEMLHFGLKLGFMFPGGFRRVLIYNLPWLLNSFVRMAESIVAMTIGHKLSIFQVVNQDSICEFVHKEQLPTFMGGTKMIAKQMPSAALPFEQMAKLVPELEHKNVIKICSYLNGIL